MRLICPNCDAQYEVPDDVLPISGRDVQCSNCGQTWFQHHPDRMPDEETEAQDHPAPDEETAPPPHPAPPVPQRKQLDPAVADILRQEAEAEKEARKANRMGSIESQPDLGADFADPSPEAASERRAREARDRMARLRGDPETENNPSQRNAATDATSATSGSRRDLLSDIEEITSSLRSGNARRISGADGMDLEIEAPTFERARRGFRIGFLTVILIFIIFAVVYIAAPRLATSVPALEAPLSTYVFLIDQLRLWLDTTLQSLLRFLDSVANESGTS